MIGLIAALLIATMLAVLLNPLPYGLGVLLSLGMATVLVYVGVRTGSRRRDALGVFFGKSAAVDIEHGRSPAPIDGQPVVVDTSVLIDGRIVDVAAAGFVPGRLLIPGFVLEELQRVADSADPFRRQKGRRGLGVVDALQKSEDVVVELVDLDFPGTPEVDARLVKLARARNASLMTQDYNLNRLAQIEGVRVLNLNDLANAVKPIVGAGESMAITIVKEGKEPHQGVGLLRGRHHGGRGERPRARGRDGHRYRDHRAPDHRRPDDLRHDRRGRFDQASGAAAGPRQGRAALTSALIVPAFGRGERAGEDKLWAVVAGQAGSRDHPRIHRRRRAATTSSPSPRRLPDGSRSGASPPQHELANVVLLEGGERRQDSVAAAIDRCDGHAWISVHDAARPLTTPEVFRAVLDAARADGAAIAGVPCVDTVKQVQDGRVAATLDRSSIIAVADAPVIRRRCPAPRTSECRDPGDHGRRRCRARRGDRRAGHGGARRPAQLQSHVSAGPRPAPLATRGGGPMTPRIGHGIDAHRFIPGRRLMLGGVLVPYHRGLLGHSDGDAVVHALVDAILGASGLGDMGRHFPSHDPQWKDTSGCEFLKVVAEKLREEGWTVASAHVIAIAEEPRLSAHLGEMSEAMSKALGLEPGTLAVGATTTDGMGFAGRGEGIAASATVLLERGDPAPARHDEP